MKPEVLRNIGIVAHIDAGKTTVSERVLFYSGVERRMGEVHEGTAVMDWMDEERRRGITITAAATSVPWRGYTINLIDTPGHVDFTVEVERCMRVLDGAVLVLNAVAGVQAQSETVWRQMQRHGVRSIAFVNQLDRPGADFLAAVGDMKSRLGVQAVPIQFPVGTGRGFRSLVDLITGELWTFAEENQGREPVCGEVPEEFRDEVGVLRSELLDVLGDGDETILTCVLEEREPEIAEVRRALRDAVVAGRLVPVLCGAALRNVGVQPLLDAVVDYLPAPTEVPPVKGEPMGGGEPIERAPAADGPLCALAFKLVADPNEDLLFTRIYSGEIRPGQKLFNPRLGRMERIARVLRMHADERHPLDCAGPGEIVALSGCKLSSTGDTLCGHDDAIVLERLQFADPVVTRVVEPKATGDRDRLRAALERLAFEDPSFHLREDEETGQWLIAGMGELHLEIKEHRLQEEFHLEVKVGKPRVAYREAPGRSARASARVDRVLGGNRVVGEVELELEPLESESTQEAFAESAPRTIVEWSEDCPIPDRMRAATAGALEQGLTVGPRFGYPLMGARVRIVGGASDRETDEELGFAQAAAQALREALAEADVVLVEPEMAFEIEAPVEFMSGIIAELNAKRADIQELSAEEGTRTVRGRVALFDMFGYATNLRSLSQGRARFSLTPAGYRRVPEEVLESRGLVWH